MLRNNCTNKLLTKTVRKYLKLSKSNPKPSWTLRAEDVEFCFISCSLCLQFSGQPAEDMKKLYSEFCSRHPKAVKLYKEVLSRDRRLQQFVRVRPGPCSDPLPSFPLVISAGTLELMWFIS